MTREKMDCHTFKKVLQNNNRFSMPSWKCGILNLHGDFTESSYLVNLQRFCRNVAECPFYWTGYWCWWISILQSFSIHFNIIEVSIIVQQFTEILQNHSKIAIYWLSLCNFHLHTFCKVWNWTFDLQCVY